MMRCWGGNVYEDHAFYDLCDERGILIWQDFAFGNTNYPQTADFVPIVEEEIGSFVRKVRNHPSIALWCSDNEIDYKNLDFRLPGRDSCYNRIAYEILLTGSFRANAGETLQIGRIPAMVCDQRLLLLHYEYGGQHFGNHFITGTPAYRPEDMLRWFEQIRRLPQPFDYEP